MDPNATYEILRAENAKLRAALKFYANTDHWKAITMATGGYGPIPVVDDSGKLAREVLK